MAHVIRTFPDKRWLLRTPPSRDYQAEHFLQARRDSLYGAFDIPYSSEASELLKLIPPPTGIPDIDVAAKRTMEALIKEERIAIFADYDVDGTTSSAMLRRFFQLLNIDAQVYIPDRIQEGYGLNPLGVRRLANQGVKLIITVDNGIASTEACEVAKQLGVDVIITDHHGIPPELPDAFAIVNPQLSTSTFPYSDLAGVGVAFYFMVALRQELRKNGYPVQNINLKQFLDYVAIGTIADMVPLEGVNHILAKVGLEVLHRNILMGARPGIKALLEKAGWSSDKPIVASDIGFKLGPRLNAAGRLSCASAAEQVLYTGDTGEAEELANELHKENSLRQELQKVYIMQANLALENMEEIPPAIVLHNDDWHTGVCGLVASRIVEKYYRPTLILGNSKDGDAKGSGRSIHGFNLFHGLGDLRPHFQSFGGHSYAVGLTIPKDKMPLLQKHLENAVVSTQTPENLLKPVYAESKLDLHSLNEVFLESLEELEPYGQKNEKPKWFVENCQILQVKRMGKDLSAGHARVLVNDGTCEAWLTAFGLAENFLEAEALTGFADVIVEASIKYWRGRKQCEYRVVDISTCEKN